MTTPLLLWPVDLQRDFVDPDGRLTVDAREIRENVRRLTAFGARVRVLGSVDAHAPEDPEFREYPEHCVRGTAGQLLIPEAEAPRALFVRNEPYTAKQLDAIAAYADGPVFLEKQNVDVFTSPNAEEMLRRLKPGLVAVYGVCTDICVSCAMEGLLKRGYRTVFVADASKALDPAAGSRCESSWLARGARRVTTESVIDRTL